MIVILTDEPNDRGKLAFTVHQAGQCDCDCDCACPTEDHETPLLSKPIAYYLELTPYCNNRCAGCGNVYATKRKEHQHPLTGEQWRKVIDRVADSTHEFKLTGGEAVLHPDFYEIASYISSFSIPFVLFTNGRWTDPDRLVSFLKWLDGNAGLLISVHGPDPAAHEAFSGVCGSFAETLGNIRRATHAGIDVSASFVIHQRNWHLIEQTLELVLAQGANSMVCNRYVGVPILNLTPNEKQLSSAMRTVVKLQKAGYPIRFGNCIPQCFEVSTSRSCAAGKTFVTIDPLGGVRPCNHAPILLGNLLKNRIEEIWVGAGMRAWRSYVADSCIGCSQFSICGGGCRAEAILLGQKRDSLVREPVAIEREEPMVKLYRSLRPIKHFVLMKDGDHYFAVRRSSVTPAPKGQEGILPYLNGEHTLDSIHAVLGSSALEWIGALNDAGMISWQ
jgi:radical SAM protein with 4Fe4S-binding SPASM domain